MADVLIVDDDKDLCKLLAQSVSQMGHMPQTAFSLETGRLKASQTEFDLILLDVNFPDGNGLDALPAFMASAFPPEIIILTGAADANGAALAVKNGAWGYLRKGMSLENLELNLSRALQYRHEKRANRRPVALKLGGIVGGGPKMQACLDLLAQSAAADVNVLITGETGVGKELFAHAIHQNSTRAEGSFVVVDCAALPENLAESILFGHEKGAFTGAERSREGLAAQADGGSLFLDEVGELPLSEQKTFLRVLEERRFRPVGGGREIKSDFRLLSATNQDLDQLAAEGRFRSDLLYRLKSMTIKLPPLRDRTEDLRDLVVFHITRICRRLGLADKGFFSGFMEALAQYHWPGNVRELVGALEQAVAVAGESRTLFVQHLPQELRLASALANLEDKSESGPDSGPGQNVDFCRPAFWNDEGGAEAGPLPLLKDFLLQQADRLEELYMVRLMEESGWDIGRAMSISGLGRTALYSRLRKYGLNRPK